MLVRRLIRLRDRRIPGRQGLRRRLWLLQARPGDQVTSLEGVLGGLLIQRRLLAEGAGNCRCSYKAGKKVRHSIHKNGPRKTKRSALARAMPSISVQYGQLSVL